MSIQLLQIPVNVSPTLFNYHFGGGGGWVIFITKSKGKKGKNSIRPKAINIHEFYRYGCNIHPPG